MYNCGAFVIYANKKQNLREQEDKKQLLAWRMYNNDEREIVQYNIEISVQMSERND